MQPPVRGRQRGDHANQNQAMRQPTRKRCVVVRGATTVKIPD